MEISREQEIYNLTLKEYRISKEILDREERHVAQNNFTRFFEQTFLFDGKPSVAERMQKAMGVHFTKLPHQTGVRKRFRKPPRHGSSVLFKSLVAYYLGWKPDARIRLLTYSETHSERFSSVIKDIMRSPEYKKIFPNKESHLSDYVRAGEWSTNAGRSRSDGEPSFMALGLGSGFVGMGGDLILIDDIYKNKEEAFSEATNEKIWGFHKEVLIPRLTVDSNLLVSFHPWNEFDYGSRLIAEGGWDDVRYAAICDSSDDPCGRKIGEALSPRYPVEYLQAIRDGGIYENKKVEGMGKQAFESLYQGNPTSRDGSLFKVESFHYVDDYERMSGSLFVCGFDWASSAESSADRTSCSLWYKRPNNTYTKVWAAFGRFDPAGTQAFIYNCCEYITRHYCKIAPVVFFIEEGIGAGSMYVQSIQTRCAEFGLRAEPTKGKDKTQRALPLIAQMEIKNVTILRDTNLPAQQREGFSFCERWNQECQKEILSFPNARHDDLVDSDTLTFNVATRIEID